MQREELEEFHYISPIANVLSILKHGILSNRLAKKYEHKSCASQEIQQRRENVILPNGKNLHDYANLYFNARNPMMHLLKDTHHDLVVISVSIAILDIQEVIISDQNASRDYTLFKPAPEGLKMLDKTLVFAEYWTHPDPIKRHEHKGIMCAEILVPDKIDASYIQKFYVSCNNSQEILTEMLTSIKNDLEVIVNGSMFFH